METKNMKVKELLHFWRMEGSTFTIVNAKCDFSHNIQDLKAVENEIVDFSTYDNKINREAWDGFYFVARVISFRTKTGSTLLFSKALPA